MLLYYYLIKFFFESFENVLKHSLNSFRECFLLSLLRGILSVFKLFQIRSFPIILFPFFVVCKLENYWFLHIDSVSRNLPEFHHCSCFYQLNLGFSNYIFTSVTNSESHDSLSHFIYLIFSLVCNSWHFQNDIVMIVLILVLEF